MYLLSRVILFFIFLLFISYRPLKAKNYRVGVLHFPPYYIVSKDSTVKGSLADLIEKVLKRADINYSLQGFPPSRLYNNLKIGKVDIWLGVKGVKEYKNVVVYSKTSPLSIDVMLYSGKDVMVPGNLSELKGEKVLVIRGYCYGGLAFFMEKKANGIFTYPVNNHLQACKMLLAKRIDFLIDYKKPVNWIVRKYKISFAGVKNRFLKRIPLFFMVSKKTEGFKILISKIDRAYTRIKAESRK